MELSELTAKIKKGDISRAAEALRITRYNAHKALYNPNHMRHEVVCATLEIIIERREELNKLIVNE